MSISLATTNAELEAAQLLFEEAIPGIAPDAVPRTTWGRQSYNISVAQYLDDDGELVGAALTCRAQVAVASTMMGDPLGFRPVLDEHSELDLIAVRPLSRSNGVGSALIQFLEQRLTAAGVKVWFGNVTTHLETERLTRLYKRHGFTIGDRGAALPLLLGRDWNPPMLGEMPEFYFYKSLGQTAAMDILSVPAVAPRKVTPPDPRKARQSGRSRKKRR